MNDYRITRGTFRDSDGKEHNGWFVFDSVAPTPLDVVLVAQIFSGDRGRAFKDQLVRAGAVEEID
jgi:hypothetical protein